MPLTTQEVRGADSRFSDASNFDLRRQIPELAVTMCQQSPAELRERFQAALNDAIVQGRKPVNEARFGPLTQAAVTLVAAEHPYASADLIADAYDVFAREHGVRD